MDLEQNQEMSAPLTSWSAGELLASANQLRRRLSVWHEFDDQSPIKRLNFVERFQLPGIRFRDITKPCRKIEADATRLLCFNAGSFVGVREGEEHVVAPMTDGGSMRPPDWDPDVVGVAARVIPELTNRSVTQQCLGNFWWQLNQAPLSAPTDYLRAVFNQVLDLPAWCAERWTDEAWNGQYYRTGRAVPLELLDELVDAANKVMATTGLVPVQHTYDISAPFQPTNSMAEQEVAKNQMSRMPQVALEVRKACDLVIDPPDKGISLHDAAMYFEGRDDKAARRLVKHWHSQKGITAVSIGKCPTDARASLYRLQDVLTDLDRLNGLNGGEKLRLSQHLTARLRAPKP